MITCSFTQRIPNGERREYLKPIMYSGGVGALSDRHLHCVHKGQPEKDMLVVKVGGPAYRIGLGGGAASSRMQDASQAALDFDAVQRGDAEMENKMNRVTLREPDRVDPRPGCGGQRAEEVNAERSGDGHSQPGGRPGHVGEGAVGVLQEVADPWWWKRWVIEE